MSRVGSISRPGVFHTPHTPRTRSADQDSYVDTLPVSLQASDMSLNSSSDPGLLPPPFLCNCFGSRVGNLVFAAFTGANILVILPLCVAVLLLGHRRRRQGSPAAASSCDFIAYHMVVMEMISVFGSILYCTGAYLGLLTAMTVAGHVFFIAACGQMLFYTLMNTECYLCVVHPITYLQMKQGCGDLTRSIFTSCVWLLSGAMMSVAILNNLSFILLVYFALQSVSLVVVSVCSFSVLRALKRAGPGEGSRVDQPKQRAFHTISAVAAVLFVRFGGSLVCSTLYTVPQLGDADRCVVIFAGFWLCLPSSLTSPLLFLHRAGRLVCFKAADEDESGQGPD